MSATVTAPVTLTIIEKLGADVRAVWTGAEHAASILVGKVAEEETSLKALVAESPIFLEAWNMGLAAADAYGMGPGIAAAETAFSAVMALAHTFAAGLASPPVPVLAVTISGAAS